MEGHERPRRLVLAMLQATMPRRLEVARRRAGQPWPPDPRAYLVSDAMPMREEAFPCVLVQCTGSQLVQSSQAGLGEFLFQYAMRAQVLVTSGREPGEEAASIGRDRMLLALREAVLLGGLGHEDYGIVRGSLAEEAGIAVETLQGRPVAVGSIEFTVNAIETLTDPVVDAAGRPVAVSAIDAHVEAGDAAAEF